MPTWNKLLRQAREGTHLTRKALAECSDTPEQTIFSHEVGRRGARRETILQLTRAHKLDGAMTNAILTAASVDPEPSPY